MRTKLLGRLSLQVVIATGIAIAIALLPGSAASQSPPPDVKKRLIEAGFGQSPTNEIYGPLLAAAPKAGVKVTKDLRYR